MIDFVPQYDLFVAETGSIVARVGVLAAVAGCFSPWRPPDGRGFAA